MVSRQIIPTMNNPSKNDLLDSFNRHYNQHPVYVRFTIDHAPIVVKVTIGSLSYNSVVGHKLIFRGITDNNKTVTGFYNSDTRTGNLEIEE